MRDYLALDRKYIWHPFTQMKEWMAEPQIVIERGEGDYLFDTEGNRYIDGMSSLWCNVHGHHRKEIDDAIRAQLDKVAHSTMLGLTHTTAIELAEKLVAIAPKGLTRVFYSDSGSEAVEIALKIAFQYWQHKGEMGKTHFVALENSYHGDTIGSVSVSGIGLFHSLFKPLLFHTYFAPAPSKPWYDRSRSSEDCLNESLGRLEQIFSDSGNLIAALVLEPLVQGAGGMYMQPKGFLKRVRELCSKHDVLLIADEVATGFGRTGKMFACEQEGVSPDIMTLAKGITGGYMPLAATLVREEIFEQFLGDHLDYRTFFHGHTYTGNPLACAAALASLEIFEREKVLEKLQPKIRLLGELVDGLRDHPHIGEVRQCGFIAALELAKDREAGEPCPPADRPAWHICQEARKRGLLIRPLGDVIVIFPPLGIAEENLRRMVEIITESIEAVCSRVFAGAAQARPEQAG